MEIFKLSSNARNKELDTDSLVVFLGFEDIVEDFSDLKLTALHHLGGETLHVALGELELLGYLVLVLDVEALV